MWRRPGRASRDVVDDRVILNKTSIGILTRRSTLVDTSMVVDPDWLRNHLVNRPGIRKRSLLPAAAGQAIMLSPPRAGQSRGRPSSAGKAPHQPRARTAVGIWAPLLAELALIANRAVVDPHPPGPASRRHEDDCLR